MITPALLDSYLGHHINDICPWKYKTDNHCAHFVSHVLQLSFGQKCHSPGGYNVRVHELFGLCAEVQLVNACGSLAAAKLLFVTGEGNVHIKGLSHVMDNVPKKHVGIAVGPNVWHYSNTKHQVVKMIIDQYLFHYAKQKNELYLGSVPQSADPIAFDGSEGTSSSSSSLGGLNFGRVR